jgi:hypothetical protein
MGREGNESVGREIKVQLWVKLKKKKSQWKKKWAHKNYMHIKSVEEKNTYKCMSGYYWTEGVGFNPDTKILG